MKLSKPLVLALLVTTLALLLATFFVLNDRNEAETQPPAVTESSTSTGEAVKWGKLLVPELGFEMMIPSIWMRS